MSSFEDWQRFFMDAKIPRDEAKQYAGIFKKNRMTFDMLMDLNKEYLNDLEIHAIGDIISILKHAKEVQNRRNTNNAMKKEAPKNAPIQRPSSSNPPPPIKKSTTVVQKPIIQSKPVEKKPEVSSRLGPPNAVVFKQDKKRDVFSRLDESPKTSKMVGLKRIADFSREEEQAESFPVKKTKYVTNTILPDGSRVKQVVEQEDPLVQRLLLKAGGRSNNEPSYKEQLLQKKIPKPILPLPSSSGESVKDRIGVKSVQQKSIKSRLSLPQQDRKSSQPEPRARKRITGPSDDPHHVAKPISERLGPRIFSSSNRRNSYY